MPHVFKMIWTPGEGDVDGNNHVNNVKYVEWMQRIAIRHSRESGCESLTESSGATWFARSHSIQYKLQAWKDEPIQVETWVVGFRKVLSSRKYRFLHQDSGRVIAEAETEWVFVDASTGKPRSIPEMMSEIFGLVP